MPLGARPGHPGPSPQLRKLKETVRTLLGLDGCTGPPTGSPKTTCGPPSSAPNTNSAPKSVAPAARAPATLPGRTSEG